MDLVVPTCKPLLLADQQQPSYLHKHYCRTGQFLWHHHSPRSSSHWLLLLLCSARKWDLVPQIQTQVSHGWQRSFLLLWVMRVGVWRTVRLINCVYLCCPPLHIQGYPIASLELHPDHDGLHQRQYVTASGSRWWGQPGPEDLGEAGHSGAGRWLCCPGNWILLGNQSAISHLNAKIRLDRRWVSCVLAVVPNEREAASVNECVLSCLWSAVPHPVMTQCRWQKTEMERPTPSPSTFSSSLETLSMSTCTAKSTCVLPRTETVCRYASYLLITVVVFNMCNWKISHIRSGSVYISDVLDFISLCVWLLDL